MIYVYIYVWKHMYNVIHQIVVSHWAHKKQRWMDLSQNITTTTTSLYLEWSPSHLNIRIYIFILYREIYYDIFWLDIQLPNNKALWFQKHTHRIFIVHNHGPQVALHDSLFCATHAQRLSNILPDVPSDMSSDIYSDIASDITSDILSDTWSDMPSDIHSDILSDMPCDILSDIYSGITSDFLSGSYI